MTTTNEQILDRAIRRLSKMSLDEQSLVQFSEMFEAAKDLTFVFIANSTTPADQVVEYGPDYLAALELTSCVNHGIDFRRPFPDEVDKDGDRLEGYHRRIQHEVEARVGELCSRPNLTFLLLWNIAGSSETHYATSADLDQDDAKSILVSHFADDLSHYIG